MLFASPANFYRAIVGCAPSGRRRLGRLGGGRTRLTNSLLRAVLGVALVAQELGVHLVVSLFEQKTRRRKEQKIVFAPSSQDTYTAHAGVPVRPRLLDTVTVRLARHGVVGVVLRLRPVC